MRLFTTLLVALLSIVGASNLNAQVVVSYENTATDPSNITTGYYVIKTKVRTSDSYWLLLDGNRIRFVSSANTPDLNSVWKIEKNENGSFYMSNARKAVYIKSQKAVNYASEPGADLTTTGNKSDATYFSARTFEVRTGTTKLDDNAFSISSDEPSATGMRQHLHVYAGNLSNEVPTVLSTWGNTIGTEYVDNRSTLVQFAFYKAEIGNDLTASPVASENNLYYLQNKSTGFYLGKNASTGTGCYVKTKEEAKQFYLAKQTDGRYKLISDNTQITVSNTVWYMSLTNDDGGKVNFTLTNAGDDYYYIRNVNGSTTQYMTSGTIGSNIQKTGSISDDCKWAFVPANDAATTARDLTIKVNAGDEVHGNIATFSASYPVVLPTDYTAYYATYNAEENYLQMNAIEGNVIPANTGVIVKGAQNATLSMKPSLETATAVSADNKLTSVGDNAYTFTDSDTNIYLLGKSKTSGQLSFIRMNTAGTQTIGAHKAYLNLSGISTESLNAIQMHFGGVIESVNTIVKNNQEDTDAPYYDLSGRRVLVPQHGIYIKGGKKVIIK